VGATALAVALAGWLVWAASPDAARPVAALGAIAVSTLVAALAARRPEPVVGALLLLGAAYWLILAIDDPPLDGRSALVGATLLAIGELGHLCLGAHGAVAAEAGSTARRFAWVAALGLLALGLGGALLAAVDLARTGGVAIDAVGAAAALAVIGILTRAAREARADAATLDLAEREVRQEL
jgi:hypothetical protein